MSYHHKYVFFSIAPDAGYADISLQVIQLWLAIKDKPADLLSQLQYDTIPAFWDLRQLDCIYDASIRPGEQRPLKL